MAPSRPVASGIAPSSSISEIFFQRDPQSQSQVVISSHFGNSINSFPGSILCPISGEGNNTNSEPSVGACSMVTDANSTLSGGPHLQRSTSFNTESYMRLPASPMSFTSNNGSSLIDGSSVVQQDQSSQMNQAQNQQHGSSSATSLPTSQKIGHDQVSLPMAGTGSYIPEHYNQSHVQKKQRLDMKQDDILRQQVMQQIQMQGHNPQLQAMLQQQRLRQQQQILQSMPQIQRAQLQQQMQLRQQLQQQGVPQPQTLPGMKRPSDGGGVCSRRLMQYLYHQRQRPADHTIAYWRKFVAEYYSPRAKKRWCLSQYENVGQHALGVFPQATMDAWHCDICGSNSGRGFEAPFEVLPRLNAMKFGRGGVLDELLFLDLPHEYRFPSGLMMLEYGKAVQESVYEHLRVVREGHLRIVFTNDLKIISWEFCARRHTELLPLKLVTPQVNQLLQVGQKCQTTIAESGSDGVSQHDIQTNGNMLHAAGRQLARTLELQSLNDLGFSKTYVRCLQIAEVVNSMKDLFEFCDDKKVGPIEGLKNYPRHAVAAKTQLQKMQEIGQQQLTVQGCLPTDRNAFNKILPIHPGLNANHQMVHHQGGTLNGPAQAALALSNYQNLLRQNSFTPKSYQQDLSSSFNNNSNSSPSTNVHISPHQRSLNAVNLLQQNQKESSSSQSSNQALVQHMNQQLMHDITNNNNNNRGGSGVVLQQQSFPVQNTTTSQAGRFQGFVDPTAPSSSAPSLNMSKLGVEPASAGNNSFKVANANSESSAGGGCGGNNDGKSGSNGKAAQDLVPRNHQLFDDAVPDIGSEFTEDDFFNSFDDTMGDFDWKA